MIGPAQTLFCCLQAVTRAAGSDGMPPDVLKWTHSYRNSFRLHTVTSELANVANDVRLGDYFGASFDEGDARDVRILVIANAADQGVPHANFSMDLALDTTLGTMSTSLFFQNGGSI